MVGRQGHSREDPIHAQQHIPVHLALPEASVTLQEVFKYRYHSPPPPSHTFPSIPFALTSLPALPLTPLLTGDPLAEVLACVVLSHGGLSHLLTFHLWPLWSAMMHIAHEMQYSHENTLTKLLFTLRAGDKWDLI